MTRPPALDLTIVLRAWMVADGTRVRAQLVSLPDMREEYVEGAAAIADAVAAELERWRGGRPADEGPSSVSSGDAGATEA